MLASAASPAPALTSVEMKQSPAKAKTSAVANVVSTTELGPNRLQVVKANDLKIKRFVTPIVNKVINPLAGRRVKGAADAASTQALLSESFENPGEDLLWLPEGWVMESKGAPELENSAKWGTISVEASATFGIIPTDGDWFMMITFSENGLDQDEWIVTPQIEIPDADYLLTFDYWHSPFWYFDSNYMDWENAGEFTERVIAADFQVLVSVDGGEFELLHSFAEEYKDIDTYPAMDLLMMEGWASANFDLGAYKGKSIKIAFRYTAKNGEGNAICLDNVKVALPSLELEMVSPFSTQYYGLTSDPIFGALNMNIATYPVYTDLYWLNYTWIDGVDCNFTWHYSDPATTDMLTSTDDPDMLTLNYAPDYTSDFTKRNNLYYPPYLTASAEGYSDGKADMPGINYIQAGGKAEWADKNGVIELGMLPFAPGVYKVGYYTEEPSDFGERAIPIFGHDSQTSKWWLDYTFRGDNVEGDACEVVAFMNYFYPTEGAPFVFDKAWVHAVGIVGADAEFTLSIHNMTAAYDGDGEYLGDVPNEEAMVSATIKGSDVLGNDDPDMINNLSLVFNFDEPVVLDDSSTSYLIKVSGFNSDKVEWFAPVQQWIPSGLAFGWIEKDITFNGGTRNSYTPIANHENEYGEMMCAFDINLGGWYPWLKAEEQTIELGEGVTGEIKLATYYNGEDLTIECSPWLTATATGRYDECVVTVVADNAEAPRDGEVTVSAPGVEPLTFKVAQATTGLNSITGNLREVKSVHTLSGVKADLSAPGVYVVTYSDGSVEKKVVK